MFENRLNPKHTTRLIHILAGLCALLLTSRADASTDWFKTDEFLSALRADLRTAAGRPVSLQDLSDLPLYDLELNVPADLASFSLTETVYYTHRETDTLDELIFQVHANLDAASKKRASYPLRVLNVTCLEQTCSHQSPHPSVLRVRPKRPLARGDRLRVRLQLVGQLETVDPAKTSFMGAMAGSFRALSGSANTESHGLLARHGRFASIANFFPVLAKRAAGRWKFVTADANGDLVSDELAHVRAVASYAADLTAISNGSVLRESVQNNARGTGKHERKLTVVAPLVRDFALVLAPDLTRSTRRVRDVEVVSYYRASNAKAGKHALDVAATALLQFERRFGKYPYVRFSTLEAPLMGGAGGVEFSGLAYIASMFYDEKLAEQFSPQQLISALSGMLGGEANEGGTELSGLLEGLGALAGGDSADALSGPLRSLQPKMAEYIKSMREFVIAHEVAHQWWHVLVGSDSREHPFADEALTQYSTLLYYEDRYGAARARSEAEKQVKMGYQTMRLAGEADGAANRPAATFSQLGYAGLVYGKAPFLYEKIRKRLGDQRFFRVMQSYVARQRFQIAPPTALFDMFAQGSHEKPIRELTQRWLEEAHGDEDLGKLDLASALGNLFSQ
jgi:hypothetical protein